MLCYNELCGRFFPGHICSLSSHTRHTLLRWGSLANSTWICFPTDHCRAPKNQSFSQSEKRWCLHLLRHVPVIIEKRWSPEATKARKRKAIKEYGRSQNLKSAVFCTPSQNVPFPIISQKRHYFKTLKDLQLRLGFQRFEKDEVTITMDFFSVLSTLPNLRHLNFSICPFLTDEMKEKLEDDEMDALLQCTPFELAVPPSPNKPFPRLQILNVYFDSISIPKRLKNEKLKIAPYFVESYLQLLPTLNSLHLARFRFERK